MRKTSVYLDEADSVRLAALAEAEGKSQAEVIRDAIRAYASRSKDARRFALDGAGQGRGGRSIADQDESELLAGFGE
jgi:predicted DNA-binding protein